MGDKHIPLTSSSRKHTSLAASSEHVPSTTSSTQPSPPKRHTLLLGHRCPPQHTRLDSDNFIHALKAAMQRPLYCFLGYHFYREMISVTGSQHGAVPVAQMRPQSDQSAPCTAKQLWTSLSQQHCLCLCLCLCLYVFLSSIRDTTRSEHVETPHYITIVDCCASRHFQERK